ncbi:DUF3822 family protein [Pedobacter sandarakinus]|uniref:DUF3822 family protein n=1 Tax=Pedobacter sandarakinus TaxID=353156 RepID=UPI002247E159|nr:DUF3822 family protein [Pedobacter sandarakinus]MCX2575204.1 DUF3822 family protein [Pedobacter sandarakinus]
MSNNSLLLVDPDFTKHEAKNCHLLLKITNDSFSYAVLDRTNKQIFVLFDRQACQDLPALLADAFQTDHYLTREYQNIKAAIHTNNFILIPNDWLTTANLDTFSNFLGSTNQILNTPHAQLGINTLYCVNSSLENKLPAKTRLFPQSSPLLALLPGLSGDGLLIDFTASSFSVLYIKNKEVQFHNHYEAENTEEFNYFLLLIIEQLALMETVPVYLQGIINEDDDYYNTLLKYFNNLYFFHPPMPQNSELLADMPKHYFSGLLALDLCE